MLNHDESFLASSVVFGADICGLQLSICYIYLTHTIVCILITQHNHNNNVYNVILIFIIIQEICKYCHEADNQL